MGSVADWGLLYAKAGWRSFPIKPGAKQPLYKNWQADATVDPKLIDQYWNNPERNLGLVCGEKFDAWDIEAAHVAAFAEHWSKFSSDTPTVSFPVASTGRGGVHILTAPTGVDGSRYLYLGGTHIGELKSRGGFILACPSETEAQYVWLDPLKVLQPLAEAPRWLSALLERPERLRKALPTRLASPADVVAVLGRLAGSVAHAGEGRRNNYLYWAVRRAVEEGVPHDKAIRTLREAGLDAGLEPHEVERTIESAMEAEAMAA